MINSARFGFGSNRKLSLALIQTKKSFKSPAKWSLKIGMHFLISTLKLSKSSIVKPTQDNNFSYDNNQLNKYTKVPGFYFKSSRFYKNGKILAYI